MYRKVSDFVVDWEETSSNTLKVIKAITNDKLNQSIVEGHNTLGWLAWHLVESGRIYAELTGLNIPGLASEQSVPSDVNEIAQKYEEMAQCLKNEAEKLTDESLTEEVEGFAGKIPRGKLLRSLIEHEIHHRGQMTVLLRQAGLPVPPVMGPTKEMENN